MVATCQVVELTAMARESSSAGTRWGVMAEPAGE